jgi:hypothetical protein
MVWAGLADDASDSVFAEPDLASDLRIRLIFAVVEPKDCLYRGSVSAPHGMLCTDLCGYLAPRIISQRRGCRLDRRSVLVRIAAHPGHAAVVGFCVVVGVARTLIELSDACGRRRFAAL